MTTDVLTRLQAEYNQLLVQYFSSYSWVNQRHPLVHPPQIAGLRFTNQRNAPVAPGQEDTQIPYPLEPVDQKTFDESQQELAEDLVLKTKQIQQLIMQLPGIDQDEEQQAATIKKLAAEVEEMDEQRLAKRKEMRQLVRRLDAVIEGMNTSIG